MSKGNWARRVAMVLGAAVLLLAPVGPAAPASAQPEGREHPPIPNRFLVFTDGNASSRAAVRADVQRRGGQVADEVRVRPDLDLLAVNVPGAAMADLAGIRGVREVAPEVPPVQMTHTPTAGEKPDWGVEHIKAPTVWTQGWTGEGIRVAVVDGGVDLGHPDLAVNGALPPLPHANCSGDAECKPGGEDGDNDGHGTGVAGIIAAVKDNNKGTVGVSHKASILAVNCFEPGTFFSCLRGVYYAAGLNQNGENPTSQPRRAQVVNMSWGWAERDLRRCASCITTIETVMQRAKDRGLVLVASAGNTGNTRGTGDSVSYPARTGIPIAVAAIDRNNRRASWSSTGPQVDLAAPGVAIESPYKNGAYTTWNGTSAAAPHVAGAAALVLDKNADLTPDQVRSYLENGALDLGSLGTDSHFGKGLVQVDRAVGAVQ